MYQATNTVARLVDRLLPKFSDADKILHVRVTHKANLYYSEGDVPELDDYQTFSQVDFLFQREHNFTKVWASINDKPINNIMSDTVEWTMESNHSSCWNSDGLSPIYTALSDVRSAIFESVMQDLKIELPDVYAEYGNRVDITTDVGGYMDFGTLYRGTVKEDPKDGTGYLHTVKLHEKWLDDTIVRHAGKIDNHYAMPRVGSTIVVMKGSHISVGQDDGIPAVIITKSSETRKVTRTLEGVNDSFCFPVKNAIVAWDDQGVECFTDINNIRMVR